MGGYVLGNQMKTALLLGVMVLLLLMVGEAIGGRAGLVMALVFSLVLNIWLYFYSDRVALMAHRARPLSEAEAPQVYRLMRELTQRANLPMPRLYLVPSEVPNAFATGRDPKHSAVAVTSGLLDLLDERELRGVLAHELAHIKNRDILVTTVAVILASAIYMLARWLQWRLLFGFGFGERRRDDPFGPIVLLLVMILAPIAALLVQMAISRSREYLADATGARISGDPIGLARALERIAGRTRGVQVHGNAAFAPLYIVNLSFRGESLAHLFSTHPPIRERVRRLHELARRMGTPA